VAQRWRLTAYRIPKMTMEVSPEERRAQFEKRWELGGVLFSKTFPDQMIDPAANAEARKFYEEKIRTVIDDPMWPSC